MSLERQKKIESVFHAAIELEGRARDEFLARECGDDEELCGEIKRLIASFERERKDAERELDSMIGRQVGAYRITGEIGRGGMGAVYAAERADGMFRTRAAVKLIKRGMDTDSILRRFRNERQILATLNHPNVARLLDGGTTNEGLPYFVMEYVEGKPLLDYCRDKNLNLGARLKIFRQICDAVEAAHEIKVVHRDLKPSNILVKADDAPKLLDFGIAKLLDPEIGAATVELTLTQWRMLTPQYASPEQVSGGAITFAADVYALGVLLYELMSGEKPYHFANHAPHEISRVICEEEPKPIADFGSRNADSKTDDLNKIVLKALRKKPSERYQTAGEFGEDIENYLANRPVRAQHFASAPTDLGNVSLGNVSLSQYKNKHSIAILPLKILGGGRGDETDEFLGIGLADALVSRLSGVQRLIVRPTSSVLFFAGANPVEAGKKIGVDYILDGSIRRVGERIRVTVQLLNVAEGSTRWAEKFDENFTDVLELEDVISERVARVLLPHLTGEERRRLEKRGTNNPAAYQAYLRGRYFANQFTDESLLKSIDAYREAIRLDPDYALPHVGIADFYVWSAIFGEIPSSQAFPKARREAEQALRVDDALGEAFAILAFITLLYDWNWTEAEILVKRALELNPNYYFAHECYSNFFSSQGVFDRALDEIKRAEELDPLSPRAKLMTSWTVYQARRFGDAVAKAEQANEMQANFPQGFLHLGNALAHDGQSDRAVESLRRASRLWRSALPKYMLCFALVADNRREEARGVLEEIETLAKTGYVKPYFLAMAHAALGESETAFEWFERAAAERDEWMIWFGAEPKLDFLREDARYLKILQKTGNPILARQTDAATGEPTTAGGEKSIAVLPFKLLNAGGTGETEDEYLAFGLADALTMRLSNVRRFLVRPTSSVLPFGGRETDPFEAGRELGVEFVVDGNIRRVGGSIRVAAQLLCVSENATRWAQRFDEDYTDVLALEDSISERVSRSLLPKLSGEEQQRLRRRGTNSPEAYEAFMRARFFFNQFTPETYLKAIEWAEKAIAIDPDYAVAHAGLAQFYNWASIFGFISPVEGYEKTRRYATRAIELDDRLSDAYAVLGFMTAFAQWDWAEGERLFKKAIELNPHDPLVYEWYAVIFAARGEYAEGAKIIRRAEELDPLSQRQMVMTAWTLYQLQSPAEALAKAEQVIEMIPAYWQGYTQKGNALEQLGRPEEAIEYLQKARRLAPGMLIPLYKICHALVRAGRLDEARAYLREIEADPANTANNPYLVGVAYAAFDEADAAFACFEKAIERRDLWLVWLPTEPKLDGLRDDPRFDALLDRINLKPLARRIEAAREAKKSLAVLPFKVIGTANEDDEFLGLGLADALTTRFSNFQKFIVRPTSSVLPFGNGETDPLTAGQNLSVEYVVDGNIRRIGDRIRVTAQLLNVSEAATDWSQPFDEKYTDVFALEDSISEKVAKSILPQFSGEDAKNLRRQGTSSGKAYEAFLKGRYYWNSMTEEGFEKALRFYEQAVALDAEYALAYASIAEAYIHLGIQCLMPFAESSRRAREAAQKAVSLDPTLAEAHAALGFSLMNADYDWQSGIIHFRRAVQINPHSTMAHFWLETYYLQTRRFDEALEEAKKIVEIEPNSLFGWHILAWAYFNGGQFDEALAILRQIIETKAIYPFANLTLSWVLRLLEKFDEAIEEAQIALRLAPNNPMYLTGLAAAFAAAGKIEESRRILAEINAVSDEKYVSPYMLAIAHVCSGETDKAFELLERAASIRDTWILWLGVDPQFESLRADARYEKILRLIKYPLAK